MSYLALEFLRHWCMIVKDGWKLAADRSDGGLTPTLMTHSNEDPYELNNRVDDDTVHALRAFLLDELSQWNLQFEKKAE